MLENEMSPAMVDHLAAGIMKKYNDQLLSAVQRMLPELNIQEAKSLDDPNRNVLDEKAIVHVIARDNRRNKYGLIIQVGSQEPGKHSGSCQRLSGRNNLWRARWLSGKRIQSDICDLSLPNRSFWQGETSL